MSFSFDGLPRSLDTAFFKRVMCEPSHAFDGDEGHGGDSLIPLSPVMGWVIVLSRGATSKERKWLEGRGFVPHVGDDHEWRRPDRPDDFA